MERTIYIVSWNGCDRIGGMERVVGIWKRVLEKEYKVVILDREYIRQSHFWRRLYVSDHPVWLMILFSLCAARCRRKGGILIGNGFNAPFVRKDISVAHGSMYAIKKALGQPVWSGSTPFEKIALRNSKKIIAVSREAAEVLVKHYGVRSDIITVINNCVDTNIFFPIKDSIHEKKTILYSGRLEPEKGMEKLLELAKYIAQRDDIKLCIATTHWINTDLFDKLKNVEVHCELKLEQMNKFYNKGDVLFFPSKCEGFEMATLESLAAGVPVVGNRVGAIRELSDRKFEGVYLLNCGTEETILKQLMEVSDIYRDDFDKRIELHSRVKKELDIEEYAARILQEVRGCFR